MKIAVFSDTHIGAYGDRIDKATGLNARQMDYVKTFYSMIGEMLIRDVEGTLFIGDAYKNAKPSPTLINIFGDGLSKLKGRSFFNCVLPGNHDLPRATGETHALAPFRWLPNVTVMDTPSFDVRHGNDDEVQIISLPYPNRAKLMARDEYKDCTAEELNRIMQGILVAALRDMASKLDPNTPSVLIAHTSIDQAKAGAEKGIMYGRDLCLSTVDIPDNIDYCFFGHIHKPQQILRQGRTGANAGDYLYIVGSMETVDFGEEGEEKRWLLLDTDEGTVESIPTGAREYKTFHMDIRPGHEVSVMGGVEGAAVRVVLHMQRGQEFDINGLRRQILEAGASSVKFEREYDEELRIQNSDIPEGGETQEDILRTYCTSKDIDPERLVAAGLKELEEVSAA